MMRSLYISFLLLIPFHSSFAQKIDYNLQSGFVADGYDVVEYFNERPQEGKDQYHFDYKGAKYRFSSKITLDQFKAEPEKYVPQYGGWCAYAMADKGEKVKIDPDTYEIRDGKLYLFYNAFFNNTLKSWLNEGPEQLRIKADENWEKIKLQE